MLTWEIRIGRLISYENPQSKEHVSLKKADKVPGCNRDQKRG